MKYLKMLGLAAVAAMALMAIGAGTASATKLCEEKQETNCTKHVASGTNLKFIAEGTTTLTGPFGEVVDKCGASTVEGPTSNTGSSTETVKGNITTLTFSACEHPVTTENTSKEKKLGSLEIHKIAGTVNGTVTSSGTTVTLHETLFGTCHFLTNNTDIGTLTGKDSATSGGKTTFDIKASIPSENCGFNGTWEGSYEYSGTTPFNVSES